MPKGVMLTHENVVSSICSVVMQLGEHRPMKSDVMISFLPLAHMLERCCEVSENNIFRGLSNYSKFILISESLAV